MKTDDLLLLAARLIGAGECEDAAKVLGDAMVTAKPRGKRCVVAMLEEITEQSAAASCNLALALLCGDGIKADPQHGARLLHDGKRKLVPTVDGGGLAARPFWPREHPCSSRAGVR